MVLDGVVKDVKTEVLFAEIRSLLLQGRQVKMRVRGRSMRPMLEHHRDSVVCNDLQNPPIVVATSF